MERHALSLPSSPFSNVSLLIAPASVSPKELLTTPLMDCVAWQTIHYLLAFSTGMRILLNHESNICYFIYKSVTQNNALNLNAPPLILTCEVEGNESGTQLSSFVM
jgi:hypothetical protein